MINDSTGWNWQIQPIQLDILAIEIRLIGRMMKFVIQIYEPIIPENDTNVDNFFVC